MELDILKKRHSLSHILAQALQRELDVNVKLGVGPAIDNGFYYDVLSENQLTEENLGKIEDQMKKIVKENQDFIRFDVDAEKAKQIVKDLGQDYKLELIEEFQSNGETNFSFYANLINAQAKDALLKGIHENYISKYSQLTEYVSKFSNVEGKFVTFVDMCEGPHVENTKEIDTGIFKLAKIAGAYWKGDSNNVMMSRIYGYAFETKDELKNYLNFLEEARKRDHRILGEKLKLFTISKLVGAGLPLLQPNGMVIKKELEDYLWELHKARGYQRVWTPHLAKAELYETSGHSKHYMDDMFSVKGGSSKEDFYVKPMNCPHHMQIFADNQFSYRDMPIRYFEPATVYRDEKTGQLSGLTRVRGLTQDDGHLFCRSNQIHQEVTTIVQVIKEFYTTMGMIQDYWVRLSLRGEDKENYLGSDEVWNTAEGALKTICEAEGLPYQEGLGEAAFYGPKLDFMFKDAIGREWQLATIQCDFNLPNRFDLSYTNEQGEKERPVVIHRAIAGSFERFMGVMIEHFAGLFPLWLAPQQIRIVPVAEKFNDFAYEIASKMKQKDLRVKVDASEDSFSKKIRNGETDKVPLVVIVGEKEMTTNTLSIRDVKTKEQYEIAVDEFISSCYEKVKNRSL